MHGPWAKTSIVAIRAVARLMAHLAESRVVTGNSTVRVPKERIVSNTGQRVFWRDEPLREAGLQAATSRLVTERAAPTSRTAEVDSMTLEASCHLGQSNFCGRAVTASATNLCVGSMGEVEVTRGALSLPLARAVAALAGQITGRGTLGELSMTDAVATFAHRRVGKQAFGGPPAGGRLGMTVEAGTHLMGAMLEEELGGTRAKHDAARRTLGGERRWYEPDQDSQAEAEEPFDPHHKASMPTISRKR